MARNEMTQNEMELSNMARHIDDFSYLSNEELIRMRHCIGCKYMAEVGNYGCCNYLISTSKRRPCKFGRKCSVKVLRPEYKLPDDYEQWCAEWDAKIEKERVERERKQRESEELYRVLITAAEEHSKRMMNAASPQGPVKKDVFQYTVHESIKIRKDPNPPGKRGRKLTWDADYAFTLYCEGFYVFDIADIIGVSHQRLCAYIEHHGWRDVQDRNRHFHRADIPEERRKYLAWRKSLDSTSKQKEQRKG